MLSISIFIVNFLLLTFLKGIGYAENPYAIIVAIGLQTVAIVIDIVSGKNEIKKIRLQLICGYFARVAILVVDIYGKQWISIPQSGRDSTMYYSMSVNVMNGGDADRGGFYATIMGNIFKLIGSNQLFAQYINLLLSMVIIYLIARVLIELEINKKVLN